LNDNKDPFEAGDLLEVKEIVEYVEVKTPHLSAELIGEILARVEDPCKIVKLMGVNKTWYQEGRQFLFKNKDKIMEEFRLKNIIKLEPFIRFLNLDRLDVFIKINKELNDQYKELNERFEKACWEHTEAELNHQNYIIDNGLYEGMEYEGLNTLMNLLSDEENDDEDIILPVESIYYNEMHEELSKLLEEKTSKWLDLRDDLYNITLQKKSFDQYMCMKVLKHFG
jgi:hypothetical protein